MKYYVKTDFVPERVTYLTVGKEYLLKNEIKHKGAIVRGELKNDAGRVNVICIKECAHLDFTDWTLIEKEKEDEPSTSKI